MLRRIAARIAAGNKVRIHLHEGYTRNQAMADLDRVEKELGKGPYIRSTEYEGGGTFLYLEACPDGLDHEDLKTLLEAVSGGAEVTDPKLLKALGGDDDLVKAPEKAGAPPKKKPTLN